MEEVVFLQKFFDHEVGEKNGCYDAIVQKLINGYLPNAQHFMTKMQVSKLFGEKTR